MTESSAKPPSLKLRKTSGWILLFASLGTGIFFLILFVEEGLRSRPINDLYFLFGAVVSALISGEILRRSYRTEPLESAGLWHLSLVDLISATFFSGILMALFKAIWPDSFAPVGMILTLFMGLIFTGGLLVASRNGCVLFRLKFLYALGCFCSVTGWMITGVLIFICSYRTIEDRDTSHALRILAKLFSNPERWASDGLPDFALRLGIAFIPIGYAMRKWVTKLLAQA